MVYKMNKKIFNIISTVLVSTSLFTASSAYASTLNNKFNYQIKGITQSDFKAIQADKTLSGEIGNIISTLKPNHEGYIFLRDKKFSLILVTFGSEKVEPIYFQSHLINKKELILGFTSYLTKINKVSKNFQPLFMIMKLNFNPVGIVKVENLKTSKFMNELTSSDFISTTNTTNKTNIPKINIKNANKILPQ